MIKLYFIQIWFGLSDPQTEDMIHDSASVGKFLGLDLSRDCPPDERTISRFRRMIERHKLGPKPAQVVNTHFEKARVRVRVGKTVEAMAIKTEPSAQNEGEKFDQGLDSTRIDN
jgi:IS5 family transposase